MAWRIKHSEADRLARELAAPMKRGPESAASFRYGQLARGERSVCRPLHALYGTSIYGGTANCGIVFALAPNLGVTAYDGENPNGLTFDAAGNLYGTTTGGGTDNPGTIFEIMHSPGGGWQEAVLYNFIAQPAISMGQDGTTLWGGPSGDTTGGLALRTYVGRVRAD